MSAKCNYSAKFLPLVKKMQLENLEEFKGFLDEYFNDSDRLYDMFTRGTATGASPLTINKVEQIDNKLGLRVSDEVDSTIEFYIGNRGQHEDMLRSFRARIIESSVFNRNTNQFIDANMPIYNTTLLNSLIFDYKKELLTKIASYLNTSESALNMSLDMEPEELTIILKSIIENFESVINSSFIDKNSTFNSAYDAYVTISKFDQLLKEQIPFIDIRPELRKTKDFYVDKYIYKGPNVRHYTGFSTNEHMNAEEHASDLSKILLDYFPEVNEIGQDINNTSITLSGFNSVMTKVVASIQGNPSMQEYLDELHKGVEANVPLLIDAYLQNLQEDKIQSENHKSYLQNKLRGIKKFIYADEMDLTVKAMFTQMILKTVPASYTAYEYDSVTKTINSKDLKERPVSQQSYALKSLIQASSYFLKTNKEVLNSKLNKYGVQINDHSILINSVNNGIPSTFSIIYEPKENGGFKYKIFGNMSDQLLSDMMYDFMSFVVPDDIDSVIRQVYPIKNLGKTDLLVPLLATTLLEASNNTNINHKNELIDLGPFAGDIRVVANVLSVINGSDTINVIKNAEGNNLPLYQIISLVYNHNAIIDEIRLQNEIDTENENVTQHNLLYNSISDNFLLSPKIRSDVNLNGKVKKPANLTVSEVLRLAIMHDFYQNLTNNGIIGLQPTTFSDKNKHFLIQFNLNQTLNTPIGALNLKSIINDFFNGQGTLDPIINILQFSRKEQINALVKNIIADYNTAFNTKLKTLQEIDLFIESKKLSLESIQKAFNAVGLDFFLDIHAYKTKLSKFPRTNETIKNYFKTFNNLELTKKRIDLERKKFLKDLLSNDFELNINTDSFLRNVFTKPEFSAFVNSSTGEVAIAKVYGKDGKLIDLNTINPDTLLSSQVKVVLNPILEAYYLTDNLLSNEYNNLMIGGVYAHPNKNSDGALDSEEYYEFSEANRLIAQYKRMVIYGATYHPYAQNLKNGVASKIKIAVINDEAGTVWNMLGDENKNLDTMDGSGFASPIQSREENNSLLDARVGKNKKTIMHSIDSRYGRPTLLKWAEFEITNEGRRTSFGSTISQEKLFRKMHSIALNKQFDLAQYYSRYQGINNFAYFKDYRTGKYYRIDNISNNFNSDGTTTIVRTITETDKNGNPTTNVLEHSFNINTLYDIDQVFGGAWSMQIDQVSNTLQYNESNIDILENIVNEEEFKDKFIAYLVNKSAIKVGAGNINNSNKFYNDDALTTIEMSTRFGGVQMNADHDLNMAEVTEMTQMISALEQNGFTHELATQIYKEIGQVVKESMRELSTTINENDKDKLYVILGKSLVQSFMNDDKDTLGLAQSFVYLANESFKNANLEYKLPFSASTINGAFVSTTTSNLVKRGIRRKYAGVASVLVPSNNMMQYFNIDGLNYKFEELADIVTSKGIEHDYDENGNIIRSNIDKALNDVFIEGNINPFIIPTTPLEIDFEDTIILADNLGNIIVDDAGDPIIMKIDSYEKYDKVRHNIEPVQYLKWTIKPKNLKQSDTRFDITVGYDDIGNTISKTFSIYDLDSVRASHFLNNRKNEIKLWSDLTNIEKEILESALNIHPDPETKLNISSILESLQKKTQLQLDMLSEGKILNNTIFGITNPNVLTVNASNIKVIPAQIIMGKLNAHKLGLLPGDSISNIKKEGPKFFYNRMQGYYNINNPDKTSYDVVLFDGIGKQFYVKVLRSEDVQKAFPNGQLSFNSDFKIVDNIVYYEGKEISNSDQKQFYKYTDSNGQIHDLIIINSIDRLGELRKSELFNCYQYNYTNYNSNILFKHQYNYNLINNIPIKLHTIDELGNSQVATFNITENLSINPDSLNQNELYNFNERLWKIAQNQFEAFNKQLLYIGARIPTQSMQSFMPMELIAFTDSEVNDIAVPKVQTWLQGSDYWANFV